MKKMTQPGLDTEKRGILTDDVIAVMNERQIPPEIASLTLEILSIAENNRRESIRKRQADGIKVARARGVLNGRPVQKPPEGFGSLVMLWERGQIKVPMILEMSGLKKATFYRRLREYQADKKKSSR